MGQGEDQPSLPSAYSGGHDLGISVNVCASQVAMMEDLEEQVLKALAVTGLPGSRLTCEVTEHTVPGVGHGQGYLYARPLPAEDFLPLLGAPSA